ncbi:MAG: AzlC family ABC transporter permease [Actinomycetes bacterium]
MSGDRPEREAPDTRAPTVRQALSVGVATGAYGVSFGALSVAAGLDVLQTCALSLLMFTGGSQFAFIGVAGAGGTPTAAVATAGMLGARNALYGLQMSRVVGAHGLLKVAAAWLTIDESTAVGSNQPTPGLRRLGFWLTGLAVFVLWNIATLAGALVGDALGDPKRWGLDAAASAAFLGLLWPRLHSGQARAVAAAAVVVATALTPVSPAGVPVLAAAAAAVALGWRSAPGSRLRSGGRARHRRDRRESPA